MNVVNSNKESRETGDFFPIERQRRLDLILHLLPNTREVVLVRGPDQSGKSFFIQQLKNQIDSSWVIYAVQVDELVQTDTPLQVLAEAFDGLDGNTKQPLIRLEAWSKAEKKIIICIEDAQKLDAARFDFLFQIVGSYDCVHIILTSSDNLGEGIESRCQLIDIEPFSQKQTAEYARNRVHKKSLDFVNVAGIDDVVLFIETGGLPGRINDVLEQMIHTNVPEQEGPKPASLVSMGLVIGAALVATVALVFFLYPNEKSESLAIPEIEEGQHLIESKAIKPVEPQEEKISVVTKTELIGNIEAKPEAIKPKPEQSKKKGAPKAVTKKALNTKKEAAGVNTKNTAVKTKTAVKEVVVPTALKKEIKKPVIAKAIKELTIIQANQQWINNRNKSHFTLQLLGVSTEESASKFITEHKVIKGLYFFQNKRNGGKWYSVIYGDFQDKEAAMKKAKKLPNSLSKIKPWVRNFEVIKKDLFVKK